MNWMLWGAVAAGTFSGACFLKGAFALDWSGMVWMLSGFVCCVVALTLLACGLLVVQA